MNFKKALIKIGIHGNRHHISNTYVNLKSYFKKQNERLNKLITWMNENGR